MSLPCMNTESQNLTKLCKTVVSYTALLSVMTTAGLTHAADVPVPTAQITNTQSLVPVQSSAQRSAVTQSGQQTNELSSDLQSMTYTSSQLLNDPLYSAAEMGRTGLNDISIPLVRISDVTYVKTTLIPTTQFGSSEQIDVSLLDDFITEISPKARHYPPNFKNASDRYYSKEKLKVLEQWLRPYAENSEASFEVLIRAAKLNGMARNLDLGSDFAIRASNFVAKAIAVQPNNAEANFLYGMMLSEGGGFKEGEKYLNKAVSLGYPEAEQSLAQSDLLNNRRSAALSRLQRLQTQNPNNMDIPRQIQIIQDGEYYIWNLPTL